MRLSGARLLQPYFTIYRMMPTTVSPKMSHYFNISSSRMVEEERMGKPLPFKGKSRKLPILYCTISPHSPLARSQSVSVTSCKGGWEMKSLF